MIDPLSASPARCDDSARRHIVQFYVGDEQALARNVARFFEAGMIRGEGAVAIATASRRAAIVEELAASNVDVDAALHAGSLLLLDAEETLARLMLRDRPVLARFERVIGSALHGLGDAGARGVRAYGEMVGILWEGGRSAAALRLEEFWNGLLERQQLQLFCGYPIDVFGPDFTVAGIDPVLCAHTHLAPAASDGQLEAAVQRAMDDVLGPQSDLLRPLMKANYRPAWAALPRGEADVLWLRNNLPDAAGPILARARWHYGTRT